MPNATAPKGKVYVCLACGKTSRDIYGESSGWDASCMLNCVLANEADLVKDKYGQVKEINGKAERPY